MESFFKTSRDAAIIGDAVNAAQRLLTMARCGKAHRAIRPKPQGESPPLLSSLSRCSPSHISDKVEMARF